MVLSSVSCKLRCHFRCLCASLSSLRACTPCMEPQLTSTGYLSLSTWSCRRNCTERLGFLSQGERSVLNEKCPLLSPPFEYLVPSRWHYLGRLRRCGLTGGGVSLGVDFKSLTPLPVSLPGSCLSIFQFLSSATTLSPPLQRLKPGTIT